LIPGVDGPGDLVGAGGHAHPKPLGHPLAAVVPTKGPRPLTPASRGWGKLRVGSLAGAAHLLHYNAGVLRGAQRGQKPLVDQKGKSLLYPYPQYWYGT